MAHHENHLTCSSEKTQASYGTSAWLKRDFTEEIIHLSQKIWPPSYSHNLKNLARLDNAGETKAFKFTPKMGREVLFSNDTNLKKLTYKKSMKKNHPHSSTIIYSHGQTR
jgi:hypothetical protein